MDANQGKNYPSNLQFCIKVISDTNKFFVGSQSLSEMFTLTFLKYNVSNILLRNKSILIWCGVDTAYNTHKRGEIQCMTLAEGARYGI